MGAPEFFVTLKGEEQPKRVRFEEIRDVRDQVASIVLLWDYNSYVINVAAKHFIINGGHRIQPDFIKDIEDPKLDFAMRRRASVSQLEVEDMFINHSSIALSERAFISYVFGIWDGDRESQHQTCLEIADDGTFWRFIGRRK